MSNATTTAAETAAKIASLITGIETDDAVAALIFALYRIRPDTPRESRRIIDALASHLIRMTAAAPDRVRIAALAQAIHERTARA